MSRETDDLELLEIGRNPETEEDLEDLALGEDYSLNPAYVPMVVDALDRGDAERLSELLAALHPADIADLMGFLSSEDREELLPHLDPEALGEILSELDTEIREDILEHLPPATLAKALGEMESDDAADVVDDLDAGKRAQVLAAMPDIERAAIDHLQRESDDLPELFFDIYIVDPAYKPVGAAPVSHLLRNHRDVPLAQIMEAVTEIPVDMDQEEVAYIFNKYHLISAPVVEPGGRLVGQITVDDIVGVIQEESDEDILALAGVSDAGRDAGIFGIVKSRLPWLVINLITEAVAVTVIAPFQPMIAEIVALVMLLPIVSSLGGNAGTQALTVAVRAIASRELNAANAMRIIGRELSVGLLNGAAVGLLLGGGLYLWQHDLKLSLVVVLAIIANLFVAALGGILAPIVLDRLGRDPAVSSSVVVTFMTDFFGFLALLGIAALILL